MFASAFGFLTMIRFHQPITRKFTLCRDARRGPAVHLDKRDIAINRRFSSFWEKDKSEIGIRHGETVD